MKFFQKIEKKLNSNVDEAVAKIFGGQIIPEELTYALQKECALSVKKFPRGEVAADLYLIALSPIDFHNEKLLNPQTKQQFQEQLLSLIKENDWETFNTLRIEYTEEHALKAGQYRLASQITNQHLTTTAQDKLAESRVNLVRLKEKDNLQTDLSLIDLNTGKEIFITKFPFLIGRNNIADLPINDLNVSRIHAQITQTPQGIELTDLDSLNGTQLNGETVTSQTLIKTGDRIDIAGHKYEISLTKKSET